MFERDYIKRLIQQFGQVVEKIMLHKKNYDWQQVQMVIDVSGKQLLGLNPDLIKNMDSSALISMFKISDEMDYEKCFILGRLLLEQVHVYKHTNVSDQYIFNTSLKSFDLFAMAFNDKQIHNKENIQTVQDCCEGLLQYDLEKSLLIRIFNFYKNISLLAEAENIILLLMKKDAQSNKKLAREFYSELLQLENSDLNKGKLPRDEVLEGLQNLDLLDKAHN